MTGVVTENQGDEDVENIALRERRGARIIQRVWRPILDGFNPLLISLRHTMPQVNNAYIRLSQIKPQNFNALERGMNSGLRNVPKAGGGTLGGKNFTCEREPLRK